jgi:hypothetical protein
MRSKLVAILLGTFLGVAGISISGALPADDGSGTGGGSGETTGTGGGSGGSTSVDTSGTGGGAGGTQK